MNPDAMIDESRVRKLRDSIVKTLREQRVSIKERNASDRMSKTLSEAIERIETAKRQLGNEEQTASQNEAEKWAEMQKAADELRAILKQK